MTGHCQQGEYILVTGGTGFLGRPLVERLLGRGEKVRVIGRRPVLRWRNNPYVDYIRADIAEPGVIESAIEGVKRVYHLAAATHGDWETYEAVTVKSSARLLECFASRGEGRIVFVSSLGNYDIKAVRNGDTLDEESSLETNPIGRGNYARAKTNADRIAQGFLKHPTLKLTIVRPGIIFGSGMKNLLVGVAFPVKGKLWVMAGWGRKPLPLIYLDDVVNALCLIMDDNRTSGKVYNLIHPHMPTQNEYLRLYRSLSGDRRPLVKIPLFPLLPFFRLADQVLSRMTSRDLQLEFKAARMIKPVYYSSERLRKDISFVPSTDFAEGLEKLFRAGNHA